ncbi:Peptidyl-prolyl cis-trans isomerase (rotamase)-cyclophilin family [Ruminococcus sp. YRD2003]|uniref:peptidylprolyl isomerase n=1 Tax=Ruminococcus sp. YRD2003 TaxID=1452313 RepID=UPI0008B43923|nr:Peptidyl-prolyl cis-trans isomerase (rotamase)-cyclophilin family [Ruminococcus flavefaciens]
MNKKKLLALALCGIMASSAFAGCGKDVEISEGSSVEATTQAAAPAEVDIMNFTAPEKGDTIIEMNIRDYGTVKIRLFPEYADKACENFVELAKKGYYDGLTFHRVIRDFMIQGGDPTGTGGGGESVWGGEFDGGTDPHLAHVSGALAYANSGGTETDGSQFYIVTGTQDITDDLFASYEGYGYSFSNKQKEIFKQAGGAPFLDGNYTVFGQVIDGLDVVFRAQYVATNANDKPLNDLVIDSVKVTEYNGEEIKWYLKDYNYDDPTKADVVNYTAPAEGETIVKMKIKDYGEVKFKLFPEYVPEAVENFVTHAKDGYYDGLTFHRIIDEFMIQGGDPLGTGTGGESIWGEKFDGGKYFNLIHAAGALAYANSGGTDSDGSQFYIVTGSVFDEDELAGAAQCTDSAKKVYTTYGGAPWLDGNYTVFGQVFDGLDVVFKIQKAETGDNDKPVKDVIIESVTVEEYDGSPLRWYPSDYEGIGDSTEAEETSEEETEAETTEEASEEETTERTV